MIKEAFKQLLMFFQLWFNFNESSMSLHWVFNIPLPSKCRCNKQKVKYFQKDSKRKLFFFFSPFLEPERVFWKQQQKRFPFPLWGSICKEHYVMNWKLSYNVFVCRKETLIYKRKRREEEGGDRNTLKTWKLCELKERVE